MKLTDLQNVQSLNEQLQALYDLEQRLNSDAVADANSFSVAFTLIDPPRGLRQTILYIGSHDMNCPMTLNELMDVIRQYIATKIGTLVSQLHDFGVVIPDASPPQTDGSYKADTPTATYLCPHCSKTHRVFDNIKPVSIECGCGTTIICDDADGTMAKAIEDASAKPPRPNKKLRNLLHANTDDRNEH